MKRIADMGSSILNHPLLSLASLFFLGTIGCGIASAHYSSNPNLAGALATAGAVSLGLGFFLAMKADSKAI